MLDGDIVRENLSKGLGFSKEDRDTNIRRIAFVANLLSRNGVPVITAAISPYREIRDEARELMDGRMIEIYAKARSRSARSATSRGSTRRRARARSRSSPAISDPYEPPENAEIVLETDKQSSRGVGAAGHLLPRRARPALAS